MKVLIACEYSGRVRDAFASLGHETISCDLLPTEQPGAHYQGDVFDIINNGFDLMVAHPPCTHLAVSGARYFAEKRKSGVQQEALEFVKKLLDANINYICLENPVSIISTKIRKPDQIIQPWQFGHGETKATCLWLKNLPLLVPSNIVDGREARIHNMAPSKDRWKERSRTYIGIAEAMANQWNNLSSVPAQVQSIVHLLPGTTTSERAMKQVSAGSYSTLSKFEKCKYQVKLGKVDKIPEPDRGEPPARFKGEWPNDRGTRIHDHSEQFVIGNNDAQLPEMHHFEDEFNHLRKLFKAGLVIPEQMWCFDKDWKPTDVNKNIKFRIKTDATVFETPTRSKAIIIDYKTGRRRGNEMGHEQQKQLYAIGAFLLFPELDFVLTELWYLDLPDEPTYPAGYNRRQAMALLNRSWGPRNTALLDETIFKPSPSAFNCKWCPYKGNACKHGV